MSDHSYFFHSLIGLLQASSVAACGGLLCRARTPPILHASLPLAGHLDRRGEHPPNNSLSDGGEWSKIKASFLLSSQSILKRLSRNFAIIIRVSPRKMRKHHGTWRFSFSAAHNLLAAHYLRRAQSGGSWGMLPLEILIRKLLHMNFGGL